MSRIGLSLLLLAFAGCGDTDNGGMEMSVEMDASMDLTMSQPDLTVNLGDMAYFHEVDAGGLSCGTSTCHGAQVCCVGGLGGGAPSADCTAPAACNGDAGLAVECNGPGNCGGNPCCLQLSGTTVQSITCTTAASDCPPALSLAETQTRACHYDGDCTAGLTNSQAPDCCHNPMVPTQRFCFSKAIAAQVPAQVVCP